MRIFNVLILFLFTLNSIMGLYLPVGDCHAQTVNLDQERVSLTIGFGPTIFMGVDEKDAKAVVDLYVKELGRSMNFEIKAVVYSGIDSIIDDLTSMQLDMVSTSLIEYRVITHKTDTELAYTNASNNRITRKWLLLVRNDSGVDRLDNLKNKTLVIGKSDAIARMFIDTLLLRNFRYPSEQFFSKIIKKRKLSSMILDLFFKKTDACLVDDWTFNTMAELNPQIQKQLKIIAASPAIINNILFFRKNISNEIKEKAEKAIEQMKSSVYGQQLLMVIKSDNIVKLEPSNLDSFNQLFNEYEERMQQWKNQVNTQQTGE